MWEDETGLSWLSMSSLVRNTLLPSHWALIGWAVDVGSISSHYLDVSPFLLICPGPSPSSQVSLGKYWLDFIHIYEDKRLLNFLELLPFISFFFALQSVTADGTQNTEESKMEELERLLELKWFYFIFIFLL